MKGKIFLFHWNEAEATDKAARLREKGWDVAIASHDGFRGGKAIKEYPPDAVFSTSNRINSIIVKVMNAK